MGIKSKISKLLAKYVQRQEDKWKTNPVGIQKKWFDYLIKSAKNTEFGKDHLFENIRSYEDFKKAVPLMDYEDLKPYIDKIYEGEKDILWPGKPLYFAKTSGTTSGTKYIPLTKESIPFHIKSARNAMLEYINQTGKSDFVDGKMIFVQGSPVLKRHNGIDIGRLSGIVAHFVPKYLQKNRMPTWETNCIEDWEEKIQAIVNETIKEDMTVISGIPPWLIMYFESLLKTTGKENISEIFQNLGLIVTGGVNYEPYRNKIEELLGKKIDVLQTYPSSEGFVGYQDNYKDDSLLLLLNHGIFYEFVLAEEYFNKNPTRISIEDVEMDKDYVLILNTNAGLWGYSLGDTVRFVNKNPYKIIISGRVKHFTSAFGEHVIGHEVEMALHNTLAKYPARVNEFTVAPQVNPESGLPYHEWLIEFGTFPLDLNRFSEELDNQLRSLNTYYDDLISGSILRPLVVTMVSRNGFNSYMKSIGKLGGQNKVPRLSNDRKIANDFHKLKLVISKVVS